MLVEGKHDYTYYDKDAEGYKASEPLYVADVKYFAWKHVTLDIKWVGRSDAGEGYMILHHSFTASRKLSGGTTYEFGPSLKGLPGRLYFADRAAVELFGKVMLWADAIAEELMEKSTQESGSEKMFTIERDDTSTG